MKIKNNIYSILPYCLLLTGVILALIQFLFNRSLWLDEASLALNIINRNCFELLKPLTYGQVAPILFLQIERFFSLMIPDSEYGLRLLPLISYLVSLFFFYQILKKTLPEPYSVVFSLSLFVFSLVLIRYSSEVKQYITDVMVSTVIFYLLVKDYPSSRNMLITITIAGITGIFLSNISPVVLSSAGIFLIFRCFRREDIHFKGLIVVFATWGVVFLVYYYFFIHHHPIRNFMIRYWSSQGAFFPIGSTYAEIQAFIINKSKDIFNHILPMGRSGIFILLPIFFLGIFRLIKDRKTGLLILMLSPLIIHFALSTFKIYPFATRFILYLIPFIIFPIGYGWSFIIQFIFRIFRSGKSGILFLIIPFLFSYFFFTKGFPVKVTELKDCLAYLKDHKNSNDSLFVDVNLSNPLRYYMQINKTEMSSVIYRKRSENENDEFFHELEKTNSVLWFLMGNSTASRNIRLLKYLDQQGIAYTRKYESYGASVWLIEFGQKSNRN